jgi:hypothetical protein
VFARIVNGRSETSVAQAHLHYSTGRQLAHAAHKAILASDNGVAAPQNRFRIKGGEQPGTGAQLLAGANVDNAQAPVQFLANGQ